MKRFISYLYSIYNNQKIHNSGFARIELRTGRNRIDIHLQESGYSGKTGTVYLFVRKKENIQGISIGNIIFRNNQADFRYEQPEENIGQTSWQIMQMNGIVILMDDQVTFLSQWDEQPVDTTRFEVWSLEKEEKEKQQENAIADHMENSEKIASDVQPGQNNSSDLQKKDELSGNSQIMQKNLNNIQNNHNKQYQIPDNNKVNQIADKEINGIVSNDNNAYVSSEKRIENKNNSNNVTNSQNAHKNRSRQYHTNYIRTNHNSQRNADNVPVQQNGAGNFRNTPLPIQNVQDAVNTMQQGQNMGQNQNIQYGSGNQERQNIQQGPRNQERQSIQQGPRNQERQNVQYGSGNQERQSIRQRPGNQQRQNIQQGLGSQQRQNIQDRPGDQERQNIQQNTSDQPQVSNIHTAEIQPQLSTHNWEQTWRYMLRIYPVLNQFADKDNVLCVRIEIKDVRLLPEKYWSVVNNSFLLHGFFNYRYLIFGRIGQNWMIGIPGIYQNQEHAMASIFGFPDFLAQERKNERGEQPGYWYRILEI